MRGFGMVWARFSTPTSWKNRVQGDLQNIEKIQLSPPRLDVLVYPLFNVFILFLLRFCRLVVSICMKRLFLMFWLVCGSSWPPSWPSWRGLGAVLGRSWALWGGCGPFLDDSWASLGRPWASLGRPLARSGTVNNGSRWATLSHAFHKFLHGAFRMPFGFDLGLGPHGFGPLFA